jgi:hypothetical protein
VIEMIFMVDGGRFMGLMVKASDGSDSGVFGGIEGRPLVLKLK